MKIIKSIVIVAAVLATATFIIAKLNRVTSITVVDRTQYNTYSGVAIKGYDPVSYFIDGPKKGSRQYQVEWGQATWHFVSIENKELFLSNPEKYTPQYGGYCAFAVTTGFTATIDPVAYTIRDDKLYLFNGEDLKLNFLVDADQSIETANRVWSEN